MGRAIVACANHLGIGMPRGRMAEKLVERQRIGLHRSVDQLSDKTTGNGAAIPTFQFHGISFAARRRRTTSS